MIPVWARSPRSPQVPGWASTDSPSPHDVARFAHPIHAPSASKEEAWLGCLEAGGFRRSVPESSWWWRVVTATRPIASHCGHSADVLGVERVAGRVTRLRQSRPSPPSLRPTGPTAAHGALSAGCHRRVFSRVGATPPRCRGALRSVEREASLIGGRGSPPVNPASGVLASMGLTRALSPSWRAVLSLWCCGGGGCASACCRRPKNAGDDAGDAGRQQDVADDVPVHERSGDMRAWVNRES